MPRPKLFNRKTLAAFSCFSGIFVFLVFIIYYQCKDLATSEAEKNLAGFLLNHKAIHYFVEEIQKPEIYHLKDEHKLYQEYFSPKLLSFTYIARNIKDALNAERKKKGLDQIYFKLASKNPRNAINNADKHELELLEAFNAGTMQEFKQVLINEHEKNLYYAIPIGANKESCMRCHGDPADAPKEMVDYYGDQAGFHERIGEIRALISVRVPLAGLMREADKTAFILSTVTFFLLSSAFGLVLFFFHKIDTQKDLAVEKTYYLNSILQSSSDTAIVATDINYNVKYFNDAAEQLFEIPTSMAINANIEKLHNRIGLTATKRFQAAIETVKAQGNYDFLLQHRHKNLEAHVSAIRDNKNKCAGFLLLAHDVSARIEEEKQRDLINARLQKAEKMESIGLMADGVAHDLNNILSGLTGYPERLLLQLPEDSELRKSIEEIKKSSIKATALVSDLLTVARGVANVREIARLNSILGEYLDSPEHHNLAISHPHITWRTELGYKLPDITCSPVHIRKCIMNMTTNAAEAIDQIGTITIGTSKYTPTDKWAGEHGLKEIEYVVLSVKDTGAGISAHNLKHIFEPFYTSKVMGRSGTGLGLTVVWNIMKEHDGTVHVSSNEQGSSFELYFPATLKEDALEPEKKC